MVTFLLLVGVVVVTGSVIAARALVAAPIGREDGAGFHALVRATRPVRVVRAMDHYVGGSASLST